MTTYYFADNAAPYAQSGAIQGDDAWNGLHPTWIGGVNGPKRNPANFNMNSLQAGDNVLFAQGGGWSTDFVMFIENPATTSMSWDNPITFDWYNHNVLLTNRPMFKTSGLGILLGGFSQTGPITRGGFVFRHLHIEGPYSSADDYAICVNPPTSHVLIELCKFSGFQAPISVRSESGGQNAYIDIHNNEVDSGRLAAILGTAQDMLVEKNDLHDNGNRHNLTHTMYLGASLNISRRMHVRVNHVYRSNIDTDGTSGQTGTFPGACVGGNITFRGQLVDFYVDDNRVENTGGKFNINAYGISHFPGYSAEEFHLYTKIRRNYTMGFQSHIAFGSCPNIEISGNIGIDNGVVGESPVTSYIGWPANTSFGSNDSTHDQAAQILNNHYTSYTPRTGSRMITNQSGVDNSPGDGVRIDGNTAIFQTLGSQTNIYMMSLTETNTTYASISNNRLNGGNGWASAYASLAAFQAHYSGLSGTACTGNNEDVE